MRLNLGCSFGLHGSDPVTPKIIMPGLKAWYGAQATLAGSLVASWTDLSGNGFHATEPSLRPTWVTNSQNGQPVVRFAGLQCLHNAYGATIAQPNTYLVVVKCSGAAGECVFDGIDGTNRNLLYHNATNTVAMVATGQVGGTPTDVTAMTTYLLIFDGVSSVLRANGAQLATGDVGAVGVAGLTIGAFEGPSNFLTGDIAALVHWAHAPTAGEIALAEAWGRAFYATW